jgi:hypothetical protein
LVTVRCVLLNKALDAKSGALELMTHDAIRAASLSEQRGTGRTPYNTEH